MREYAFGRKESGQFEARGHAWVPVGADDGGNEKFIGLEQDVQLLQVGRQHAQG